MRRFLLILSALTACAPAALAPAPALAQWNVTYDGCQVMGRPVPSIPSPSLGAMAEARIDPAFGPAILYDPAMTNRVRPEVRAFASFRECGRLALGRPLGLTQTQGDDQAADCWAVRELFARGVFGRAQLQTVQTEIAARPGQGRTVNLWACLGR